MMRHFAFLITSFFVANFLLEPLPASASSLVRLQCAARDYETAAQSFHRSLCSCRRGTPYAERLADRLACAARELSDAVHHGDSRHILRTFDEVSVIHDSLDRLFVRDCHRPDPMILGLWRNQEHVYRRLDSAIELYRPTCAPLPFPPHPLGLPPFPGISISSPSGFPWFAKGHWSGWGDSDRGPIHGDHDHRRTSPHDLRPNPKEQFDRGRIGDRFDGAFDSGREHSGRREGIRYQPGRYGRIDNSSRR